MNGSRNGRSGLSIGVMPCLPLVRLKRADAEDALVAVDRDAADDLAEGERHDRDVVAAQAQRREADDRAEDRRDQRREREDDQEVEVDAGQVLRELATRDVDVRRSAKCAEANQPTV